MDIPIAISVVTQYLPEHENANNGKFMFAYQISIHNKSTVPVTLMNRYWLVTDGNGKQTEVKGPGVIGQQPNIKPNATFTYTSGVALDTPVGTMQGKYEMALQDQTMFNTNIDVFSLSVPKSIH
ncbi:Co2+/Mg2+ efflux protein ApaG [Alteromonas sp. 5E99-2]|uniref:Co2+/Mg2+ efflux protein ApaG n=1 Tax=Alteromonas sp. 5E99-2 TaxID=2817683 RepID=UPI001A98F27E|nr:Co2+/Mg2+ efflux protein ApaG [Alteromonas sp. 5E99-2]MBO1254325.1 Co2+/Mg2+ efflux protein ApaG [Alteromonas sp. 5E99-2]